jgi:general secretion pathway protein K
MTMNARRQSGIALVLALWLTVLLTAIAGSFAFAMRSEALSARNSVSVAQARAAADGAIERVAVELQRPRLVDAWVADGQPQKWQDGDVSLVVTAADESSKIDINFAQDALLRGLLMNVGGLDADAATKVVDAILDWRDPDELRRPNGAEAPDYTAAGLKYAPANGPFETTGELARVLGVTPALFAKIGSSITVHSRSPGVNTATATRDVLLALPNATPEAVDAFIALRTDALAAKLPVPPFAPASGLSANASQTWRIRAEASLADGVTFVREAVLRPAQDPRRVLIVLAWQEGARAASGPAAPESPTSSAGSDGRK